MKLKAALVIGLGLLPCWYYAVLYQRNSSCGLKSGIVVDLYPLWNAGRAILDGRDPYSDRVMRENEIAADGDMPHSPLNPIRQRFAYPIFAAFPVLPLALLTFPAVKMLATAAFAALAMLCVYWIRGRWDAATWVSCGLFFSFYPLIYDLQACQPTLLYFGLALGGFAALRRKNAILAAVLSALALGKPQVSLPIILAMALCGGAKRGLHFLLWLGGSLTVLIGIGLTLNSHWISEWMSAANAYAGYIRASLLVEWFGPSVGAALSATILCALAIFFWLKRGEEPLFPASIATLALFFVFPYQTYNSICLLLPALWAVDNLPADSLSSVGIRVALFAVMVGNLAGVALWSRSPVIAANMPHVYTQILLWSLAVGYGLWAVQPAAITPPASIGFTD